MYVLRKQGVLISIRTNGINHELQLFLFWKEKKIELDLETEDKIVLHGHASQNPD